MTELETQMNNNSIHSTSAINPNSSSSLLKTWFDKLNHPLISIRIRTLSRLLFKLQSNLISIEEFSEPTLVHVLLDCAKEPEMEGKCIQIINILLQNPPVGFLAALQLYGICEQLQRLCATASPTTRSNYEHFLQQIYTVYTSRRTIDTPDTIQVGASQILSEKNAISTNTKLPHDLKREELNASNIRNIKSLNKDQGKNMLKTDKMVYNGWHFAPIRLVTIDEQYLFEFEVKLKLHTAPDDVVKACTIFRKSILRNFPAELFLQRPAMLEYLCHLVQLPIIPIDSSTPPLYGVTFFAENYMHTFSSKPIYTAATIFVASLQAIEALVTALKIALNTSLDPTFTVFPSILEADSMARYTTDTRSAYYPRIVTDPEKKYENLLDSKIQYSLGGGLLKIFLILLRILQTNGHPNLWILNILHTMVPMLHEISKTDDCHNNSGGKKQSFELIFNQLDAVLPVILGNYKNSTLDSCNSLSCHVLWRFVELINSLFHINTPITYQVEKIQSKQSLLEDDRQIIKIPGSFWDALTSLLVCHIGNLVDDNVLMDLYQVMSTIDPELKSIYDKQMQSAGNQFISHEVEASEAIKCLIASKKHCTFLHSLFNILQLTECGHETIRQNLLNAWWPTDSTNGGIFERYLQELPTSDRDVIVLSSIIALWNRILTNRKSEADLVHIMICMERFLLPMLRLSTLEKNRGSLGSRSILSEQIMRLLLRLAYCASSSMIFLSMHFDTTLANLLAEHIGHHSLTVTTPILQEITMQTFAGLFNFSTVTNEAISIVFARLVSFANRHRMSGSFQDQGRSLVLSEVLLKILVKTADITYFDELINWVTSCIFDSYSRSRIIGFKSLRVILSLKDRRDLHEVPEKVLQLAFDVAMDPTECDGVCSNALEVCFDIFSLLISGECEERQRVKLQELTSQLTLHKLISSFISNNSSIRLKINWEVSLLRVLRLYLRPDAINREANWKVFQSTNESYDLYGILVKNLSVGSVYERYAAHIKKYSRIVPHEASNDSIWNNSIISAGLQSIRERLLLIIMICHEQPDSIKYFNEHTTLLYQVMQVFGELYDVLTTLPQYDCLVEKESFKVVAVASDVLRVQLDYQSKYLKPGISKMHPQNLPRFAKESVKCSEIVINLIKIRGLPKDTQAALSSLISSMASRTFFTFFFQNPVVTSARSLCSLLKEIYFNASEEIAIMVHSISTPFSATAYNKEEILPTLDRLTSVSQALLQLASNSDELRQFILNEGTYQVCVKGTQEILACIRISDEIAHNKAQKTLRRKEDNTSKKVLLQRENLVQLLLALNAHINLLASIISDTSEDNKKSILDILTSYWDVLKVAHDLRSFVFISVGCLVNNLVHENNTLKVYSTAVRTSTLNSAGDRHKSLLSLLLDLALEKIKLSADIQNETYLTAFHYTVCKTIQSVLLNPECVAASIKFGDIYKLIQRVQNDLQRHVHGKGKSKRSIGDDQWIANLLYVLANIALCQEGQTAICSKLGRSLREFILEDILGSISGSQVQLAGSLFLRNISPYLSKTHLLVWGVIGFVRIIEVLEEALVISSSLEVGKFLAQTLWWLTYENEKARAILMGNSGMMANLKQLIATVNANARITTTETLNSTKPSKIKDEIIQLLIRITTGN